MAGQSLLSGVELEKEAIAKYNAILQRSLEREKLIKRFNLWRGNKLPPFSIAHMPYERQRLDGAGMTAEDRMLRKQWLNDQVLSPKEPRFVPELYPRNPLRRFMGLPWDLLFKALRPALGENLALKGRYYVPKYALGVSLAYWFIYHVKYNPNTWENQDGWWIISSKPESYPGDAPIPDRFQDDFHDQGFKSRKVLLDLDNATSVDK